MTTHLRPSPIDGRTVLHIVEPRPDVPPIVYRPTRWDRWMGALGFLALLGASWLLFGLIGWAIWWVLT